jgi:transcription elongation GreA/GreB family factor
LARAGNIPPAFGFPAHVDFSPDHLPMSVAFTKEGDSEAFAADLLDRPISPNPNLVTARGLAQLETWLADARAAYSAAQATGGVAEDRTAMARATRDLRFYAARRASAQLTEPSGPVDVVHFGQAVTFDREDGRRQTFRIVGEDEADPADGSVSYVSPLARALLGKTIGDTAMVAGGEVEIVSIA